MPVVNSKGRVVNSIFLVVNSLLRVVNSILRVVNSRLRVVSSVLLVVRFHKCTGEKRTHGCTCKITRTAMVSRVAVGDSYPAAKAMKFARCPPQRSTGRGRRWSIVANPGWMERHPRQYQDHQFQRWRRFWETASGAWGRELVAHSGRYASAITRAPGT